MLNHRAGEVQTSQQSNITFENDAHISVTSFLGNAGEFSGRPPKRGIRVIILAGVEPTKPLKAVAGFCLTRSEKSPKAAGAHFNFVILHSA